MSKTLLYITEQITYVVDDGENVYELMRNFLNDPTAYMHDLQREIDGIEGEGGKLRSLTDEERAEMERAVNDS